MVHCTIRVKVILRRTISALPNGVDERLRPAFVANRAGFELSKEINLTLTQAESGRLSCPRNAAVLNLKLARLGRTPRKRRIYISFKRDALAARFRSRGLKEVEE